MKKTIIFLMGFVLLSMGAWSTTVQKIGKFSYELDETRALATLVKKPGTGDNESYNLSGDIVIPGIVEYNSVSYLVKEIGYEAFLNCGFSSVTVEEGVQTINNFAFMGCGFLKSITLPSTITGFGNQVFAWSGLTTMNILAATPPTFNYGSPFSDMSNKLEHLNVPYNSMDTYKKDANWSVYADIIGAADGSAPESITWTEEDLKTIRLFMNGSITINYITLTAFSRIVMEGNTPTSPDYCHFMYDNDPQALYTGFSMRDSSTFTFSTGLGNFKRIIISCDAYNTEHLKAKSGWKWNSEKKQLIWTGDTTSVVLATDGSANNVTSGPITSIEFVFDGAEPDPVPDPITWGQADLQNIDISAMAEDYSQYQTVKDITATASSATSADYCHLSTYDSNTSIRIAGNGKLTFTHATDNITGIIIGCSPSGYYDLSHLAQGTGWTWDDNNYLLSWSGDADTVTLKSDGSSEAMYIGTISYISFSFGQNSSGPISQHETELSFNQSKVMIYKDIYGTLFEPGTDQAPEMTYSLSVTVNADGEDVSYKPSELNLPISYSVSNKNVISITPSADRNSFTFQVNGYGEATVVASTPGNESFKATSATITITVAQGKGANSEAVLGYAGGGLVPEGKTFSLKTGEELPEFELRDKQNPEKQLSPVALIVGSIKKHLTYNASNNTFRAISAGEDMVMLQYSRYEDGDENGDWLLIWVPVQVLPSQAAMSSSPSFATDPTSSGVMTVNAAYDGTQHCINVNEAMTDETVAQALSKLPYGSAEWNAALPNTISFEVTGKGRITLYGTVQQGYEVRVQIRDNKDVAKYSSEKMAGGQAFYDYEVENQTTVVIYVAAVGGSGSAPRRAPSATNDAPLAMLTGIEMALVYSIAATADPESTDVYYSTIYNKTQKYLLPAGTEAYVATVSGEEMSLTKVVSGGEVLPANTPVILKSSVAEIELLPTNAEAQPVTATNHLRGTDTEMEAPANCYVLDTHTADNNVSGIGFYQFSGSLIPHKVYVIRDESGAPKRLHFVFNNEQQTTGLDNTNSAVKSEKRIENGQLIIIKNGARYNVQGLIVK
jgi:hypothetical protein